MVRDCKPENTLSKEMKVEKVIEQLSSTKATTYLPSLSSNLSNWAAHWLLSTYFTLKCLNTTSHTSNEIIRSFLPVILIYIARNDLDV